MTDNQIREGFRDSYPEGIREEDSSFRRKLQRKEHRGYINRKYKVRDDGRYFKAKKYRNL